MKIFSCSNYSFASLDNITDLHANRFLHKRASNVCNSTLRTLPFSSFDLRSVVSIVAFTIQLESSGDLTSYIISFVSSFEIINVGIPEPRIFL